MKKFTLGGTQLQHSAPCHYSIIGGLTNQNFILADVNTLSIERYVVPIVAMKQSVCTKQFILVMYVCNRKPDDGSYTAETCSFFISP
jgi:hypothetical protein